jgi:hypothetical protein
MKPARRSSLANICVLAYVERNVQNNAESVAKAKRKNPNIG